ncbi:hypothetical protein [Foliimonas ilicis]|uniref:hypothetical protein n=1 Tax=Mesorhizobium sp. SB112 TaxID=3151853 RepID=UPI003266E531
MVPSWRTLHLWPILKVFSHRQQRLQPWKSAAGTVREIGNSSERLAYEKDMLRDWFRKRFFKLSAPHG